LRHSGGAEDRDGEQGKGGAYGDPDGNSDPDQHAPAPPSGTQPLLAASPTRRRAYAAAIREASSPAGMGTAGQSLRYLALDLRVVGSEWSVIGFSVGKAAFAGKTSNGMYGDRTPFHASSANEAASSSSVSREKPRPARRRRSAGVTLSPVTSRRARSSSGSSEATAAAAVSAAISRRLRSARIAASPYPRRASSSARLSASRASSTS